MIIKRFISIFICLALILPLLFSSLPISAVDFKEYGIDASSWQGNVDWSLVAKSGVKFAILRAGFTDGTDGKFEEYYKGCKANGIKVGIYYYSYATTVAQAEKDASNLLKNMEGKTFEYPIYIDMEDSCQTGLGKTLITNIAMAFCNKISTAGYYTGIYANKNWFTNYLDKQAFINAGYTIWLASWLSSDNDSIDNSSVCDVWQYYNKGKVSGITDNVVDLNVSYIDFASIIKEKGLNGFPPLNPVNITISFNSNGGSSVSSLSRKSGNTYYSLPTPQKSGYLFQGWYTSSSLSGERVKISNTVPRSNITLYAKWIKATTGSGYVEYWTNGNSYSPFATYPSMSDIIIKFDLCLLKPGTSKEGYTYTRSNFGINMGGTTFFFENDGVYSDGNKAERIATYPTSWGSYEWTNWHTMEIHVNSGKAFFYIDGKETRFDGTGYTFSPSQLYLLLHPVQGVSAIDNLSITKNDGTVLQKSDFESNDSILLGSAYGGTGVRTKFSNPVTYYVDGNKSVIPSQTKYLGYDLSLASTIPEKPCYSFIGWSTSEGGKIQYSPGDTYSSESALNLYAVWSSPAHTFVDNICTVCGEINDACPNSESGHSFVSKITTESTDTQNGKVTYTCSLCNFSYDETINSLSYGKNGLQNIVGVWKYYSNGTVDTNFTGLAKNQYGWFFVKNGILDKTYTGLAKNQYGWFYVKNGALDKTYTGLAKNQYGWFYVKNGALDKTYTGLAKNQYGWFYVKNGTINKTYTGLAKNQYGWFFVKGGTINKTYTGLAKNAYGTWLVKNGTIYKNYTGNYKLSSSDLILKGKTVYIKSGKYIKTV